MMSDALRPGWCWDVVKPLFLSLVSLIRFCLSHHGRSSAPGLLFFLFLFLQSSITSTPTRWSLLSYETPIMYETAHKNIFLSLIRPGGFSDMASELWLLGLGVKDLRLFGNLQFGPELASVRLSWIQCYTHYCASLITKGYLELVDDLVGVA